MTDLRYLIITDLDGTLLNYETFSYKPIVSFIKKIEFGIKEVKKLKKAKGFEKILHPGEPEFNNEILNSKRGILLSIDTIKELEKLSVKYNVKSPFKI